MRLLGQRFRRRLTRVGRLSVVGAGFVAAAILQGDTRAATWTGTTSVDWNDATNWTSTPAGVNDYVSTETGNFPVIGTAPTFTPVDLFIGSGAGPAGSLDQTTGTLAPLPE